MELNKHYCNHCQKTTNHIVKTEHKEKGIAEDKELFSWDGEQMNCTYSYQVIECAGCNTISFLKRETITTDLAYKMLSFDELYKQHIEDWGEQSKSLTAFRETEWEEERKRWKSFDNEFVKWLHEVWSYYNSVGVEKELLQLPQLNGFTRSDGKFYHGISDDIILQTYYPVRTESLKHSVKIEGLPANIKNLYEEVIDCFNQWMFVPCAIALRATIEEICKTLKIDDEDYFIKAKIARNESITLNNRIVALSNTQRIGKELSESLKMITFLGNNAAHKLEKPTYKDLLFAIETLEMTMKQLFEFPQKHSKATSDLTNRLSNE